MIGLLSCNQKTEDAGKTYIPKPPAIQHDSLAQWLRNPQNLANPDYKKIFFARFEKEKQRKQYDSAAQTLVNFGSTLIATGQYDSTFLYTTLQFTKAYEKQLSPEYYNRLVYNLGIQYSKGSPTKQDSAIYWYKKTFIPSESYIMLRNQANSKSMLTWIYISTGKIDSALIFTQGALAISERLRDTASVTAAWLSLYAIYEQINAYQEADRCLNKALVISKIMKDTTNLNYCYYNKIRLLLSSNNNMWKQLTAADTLIFPYTDTLLHLYEAQKVKNPNFQFHAYFYAIRKEVLQGNFVRAKQYLDTCKVAADSVQTPDIQQKYLLIKAFHEVKTQKGITDLKSYEQLIADSEVSNDFATLFYMYEVLEEDAKLKKDYPLALDYTEKKFGYRDSIGNQNMRGKIFELEKKYQTEKKEKEIVLQKEEILAKNRLIFSLGLSLLTLFLVGFIYLLWQKQQTMKKESQQKQEFTHQLLQNTEEERKRIAYDLHDSIGHELLSLKRELKTDIAQVDTKVDIILAQVRDISRNLHPVMFDKIGLQISLEDLINNFQQQQDIFVSTDIEYTAGILPLHVELQMYRIVQEALSNIKKYAEAKAAKVSIITHPNHISLEIKDNGKGFNVAETLASKKAFGLHSIIERSNTIGGNAQITSSAQGTLILISIPILS